MKPLFTHNCEVCIFLGTFNNHDLYFCNQVFGVPFTILARGSDEPADYKSGFSFAGCDEELREAYTRAKEKGLIKK